jgi:hypothetical protein
MTQVCIVANSQVVVIRFRRAFQTVTCGDADIGRET